MRILAIDDEEPALKILTYAIAEARPQDEVFSFTEPSELLTLAKEKPCDIAFLDIEMREMSGLELAKRLKEINPRVNIIFATGYSQYMGDAFSLRASGYVMKPVTKKSVVTEIENLRNTIDKRKSAKIFVQTFGNFEIFVDGKPLEFSRKMTKELFAYLIDRRGAECGINEIVSVLWEDKNGTRALQSYLRNLVADLSATLKSVNAEDLFIKKHGIVSIDIGKLECDYYDFCRGESYAVNSYAGEYMAQFEWAELTNGYLEYKI